MLCAANTVAFPTHAEVRSFEVFSRPITHFRIDSRETRFGPLEFVGGLEMTSWERDFGALSSIRMLPGGDAFLGVADTGFWFSGRLVRDEKDAPAGVADFRMADILDAKGKPRPQKWEADAEGVALDGDDAIVSFERVHAISRFTLDLTEFASRPREMGIPVSLRELRSNKGFETLALAPPASPLAGALVAVTERSLDKQRNIMAAVIGGKRAGEFSVKRIGVYDITDGDFLPNGDLLLLERRFSMADGVAMRIRRIAGKDIKPGATVDGPIVLEADMRYQIDNMEGLSVSRGANGYTLVTLVSDDNHSLLQRNLLLQFRWVE